MAVAAAGGMAGTSRRLHGSTQASAGGFALPSTKTDDVRKIDLNDLLPLEAYMQQRSEIDPVRKEERARRLMQVGPKTSVSWENYDSIWFQIQEMLRIEKGGDEQALEEIASYADLIPQGEELILTLYIEEGRREARQRLLRQLVGIEKHVELQFGKGQVVKAEPITSDGVDRSTNDGKTSAVHFLRMGFTADQMSEFEEAKAAMLVVTHPEYGHAASLKPDLLEDLKRDFLL